MTLHRNRHRQERRRRLLSAVVRTGLLAGALATTAFYSYRVGIELERRDLAEMQSELESLRSTVTASSAEADRLRAALDESRREAERYRVLAEQAPSTEDSRELLRLVQSKLGAGMGKDRLATYITAAQAPKKCGETVVRKFVAKVKGAKGETATAKLSDGLVLSASGVPAKDANGRDEHWYDTAKPVTLVIAEPGGNQTETSGVLPMEHMLVLKNAEYRFSVAPGPRGFVSVTVDRCEMVTG